MRNSSGNRYQLVLALVALVWGCGLLAPPGGAAGQPTVIDSCGTITEPGEYALANDIGGRETGLSESCLRIVASDVHLDGRGHRVVGIGVSDTTGIAVNGTTTLRNVSVGNVTVAGWNQGIYLENVTRSEISGTTARQNAFGITLHDVSRTTIRDCRFSRNLVDLYRDEASTDLAIENNGSASETDEEPS